MNSLQCFKDKEKLVQELLNIKHNTEKIVYFLLLDRKLRQPSEDDADDVKAKSSIYTDPPRKRVDAMPLNKQHPRFSLGSLTEGSPLAPRRALTIQQWRRNKSLQNCSSNASLSSMVTMSPSSSSSGEAMIIASSKSSTNIDNSRFQLANLSSPKHLSASSTVQSTSDNSMQRQHRRQHSLQSRIQSQQQPSSYRQKLLHLTQQQKIQQKQQQQQQQLQVPSPGAGDASPTMSPPSSPSSSTSTQFAPWKARLHSLKNSFLGSPRFHRKKMQKPSTEDLTITPGSSSEFTKKSWFGALIGSERDEQCYVMVKDKNMGQVKADLIHAFLCMPDLSHTVLSPTSFHAEYRRNTSASVFSRHVKLQVDISAVHTETSTDNVPHLHCLTFTLLSGPSRRFKRLCELFQSIMSSSRNHGEVSMVTRRISSTDLGSEGLEYMKGSLFSLSQEEYDKKSTAGRNGQRRSHSQSEDGSETVVISNDVISDVTCDVIISDMASLVASTHM